MLEHLKPIEARSTRYDKMQENLAYSLGMCDQRGLPLAVDTITCPLYRFSGSLGAYENFSTISGLEELLDAAPRYLDKFRRFLGTLSRVREFLEPKGYPIVARIIFGDVGILNVEQLRRQFGGDGEECVRIALQRSADAYKRYLSHEKTKQEFGLEGANMEFANLTDLMPFLRDLPLDLCELALSSRAVALNSGGGAQINEEELTKLGVNDKIIRAAQHNALYLALGRMKEGIEKKPEDKYSVIQKAYLEVGGFLIAYGLAGKGLDGHINEDKTGLLISIDTPGTYRNDFYYAFLKCKGADLAIFTPASIDVVTAALAGRGND